MPREGAGVILQAASTGRVLCVLRAKHLKSHPSRWTFPGGFVEVAQPTMADRILAARRELQEETSLALTPEAEAVAGVRYRRWDGSLVFHTFLFRCDAEYVPTLDPKEVADYAWLQPTSIPHLRTVPGVASAVNTLRKRGWFPQL